MLVNLTIDYINFFFQKQKENSKGKLSSKPLRRMEFAKQDTEDKGASQKESSVYLHRVP